MANVLECVYVKEYDDELRETIERYKKHDSNREGKTVKTFLSQVLGLKPLLENEIYTILDNISVRDINKLSLTSVLVDNWCIAKKEKGYYYIKHIWSEKKNSMYQIILGNGNADGVYILGLKGKEVNYKIVKTMSGKKLILNCPGNYEVAELKKCGSIIRDMFETEEDFVNALIENDMITEEEAEIYVNPDEVIAPYLQKQLTKIEFA